MIVAARGVPFGEKVSHRLAQRPGSYVILKYVHLERALRVIPMGKKNWLFSWTELGAKHIGIVQSLLATCRLHDINPCEYFVDVLQRVGAPSISGGARNVGFK